jgi:hypothetical protein
MKKQFKIGEYALGGIIEVIVKKDTVIIDALDYNTKKSIPFSKAQFDIKYKNEIDCYLNNLTTCYYSDKILEYIYKN